jgi:hypothetical protein
LIAWVTRAHNDAREDYDDDDEDGDEDGGDDGGGDDGDGASVWTTTRARASSSA